MGFSPTEVGGGGRGSVGLDPFWSEGRGVGLAPPGYGGGALAWPLVELKRRLGSGYLLEVGGSVGLAPFRNWRRRLGLAHTGAG